MTVPNTSERLVHPDECEHCPAREVGLFSDITGEERDRLLGRLRHLRGPAGTVLYREGDPGHDIFVIRLGFVKVLALAPDGSERIVRLARPGDVLGLSMLAGRTHPRTSVALTQFDACRVPVDLVIDEAHRVKGLERKLFAQWESSLETAYRFLAELATGSAPVRLARLLLFLLEGNPYGICPAISREEMGSVLGITTETASRIVADLKRHGVISETGHVFRCDTERLHALTTGGAG